MTTMRAYPTYGAMVSDSHNARVGDNAMVGHALYYFGAGRTWAHITDKDSPLARAKSELYVAVEVMWDQLSNAEKQRFYREHADRHRQDAARATQQAEMRKMMSESWPPSVHSLGGSEHLLEQLRGYKYKKGPSK